jgi:hypothetical protein
MEVDHQLLVEGDPEVHLESQPMYHQHPKQGTKIQIINKGQG